jgi:hypothetical protein
MSWEITQADETSYLIMKGDRLVGSICTVSPPGVSDRVEQFHGLEQPSWRVEIPWTGPTGDITATFPTLQLARAFVQGAEAVFNIVEHEAFNW